ncbi:hypothetical protein GCM10027194_19680 [Thalassiella azotivora]
MLRPVLVRVLAAVVWVLLALFAGLAVLEGAGQLAVTAPALVLVGAAAYALLWRPCVVVDDDAVTLVNVLRDVRVPFAALDVVDTRYALSLESGGRRWSAWAAPAPGRFSAMGLSRSEGAVVRHLGVDVEHGLRASSAPNTESGGAALLVQSRWLRWQERHDGPGRTASTAGPAGPRVTWVTPLAAVLAVSAVLTALTFLL